MRAAEKAQLDRLLLASPCSCKVPTLTFPVTASVHLRPPALYLTLLARLVMREACLPRASLPSGGLLKYVALESVVKQSLI